MLLANSVLFLTIFLFSACSQTSLSVNKEMCQWKSINLNGNNNFCSSVRSSIVYDDNIVLAFDNGTISTWSLSSYKQKLIFDTESDYTRRAMVKMNDKIISGSSNMNLYIHSIDGKLIKEKNYEKGSIFNIVPYKEKLYIAFGNAEIGIVDSKSLNLLDSYSQHQYLVYSLYLDEKEKLLYSGSDDNSIIIWDVLNSGQLNMKKSINGFNGAVKHILKYKNSFIVSTGKGNILMYNASFKKLLFQEELYNNITSTLVVSNILYVGDSKGRLSIFKLMENSLKLDNEIQLNGLIRSIKKYKQNIIIITKTGVIRMIPEPK